MPPTTPLSRCAGTATEAFEFVRQAPSSEAVHTALSVLRSAVAEADELLRDGQPAAVIRWLAAVCRSPVATSSFGVTSAVLLGEIADVAPTIPVVFFDTGFHFEETLTHVSATAAHLPNPVQRHVPTMTVDRQELTHGPALDQVDPDRCCHLRKVLPLRRLFRRHDGWITGIRREQTEVRRRTPVLSLVEVGEHWVIRAAPLAAWTREEVDSAVRRTELPRHPLAERGYTSVGCKPCTAPPSTASGRAARWAGREKTECGLHTHVRPI